MTENELKAIEEYLADKTDRGPLQNWAHSLAIILTLIAEVRRLSPLAKRYEYLRGQKENLAVCFENSDAPVSFGLWDVCDGRSQEKLDAAVDDAMQKEAALTPSR